jgi:hypothetical protein
VALGLVSIQSLEGSLKVVTSDQLLQVSQDLGYNIIIPNFTSWTQAQTQTQSPQAEETSSVDRPTKRKASISISLRASKRLEVGKNLLSLFSTGL